MKQKEQLLNYLKKHNSITPLEALSELGIYRLSARIHDLRSDGIGITTLRMETGNNKNYAKYILDK